MFWPSSASWASFDRDFNDFSAFFNDYLFVNNVNNHIFCRIFNLLSMCCQKAYMHYDNSVEREHVAVRRYSLHWCLGPRERESMNITAVLTAEAIAACCSAYGGRSDGQHDH